MSSLQQQFSGAIGQPAEFERGAGLDFAESLAVTPESLNENVFLNYLKEQEGLAQAAGARTGQAASGQSGFGRSTFSDAMSQQAGQQAGQPYRASRQDFMNLLQNQAFQGEMTGLGLDQYLYGQGEQSRQFNAEALMQAIMGDANLEEQERQRNAAGGMNLLQTGLGVGALALSPQLGLGSALSSLFGGGKGSSQYSDGKSGGIVLDA